MHRSEYRNIDYSYHEMEPYPTTITNGPVKSRPLGGASTLAEGIVVLSSIANAAQIRRSATAFRGCPRRPCIAGCHDGDRTYRFGMRPIEMAHHVWETFGGERPLWVNSRPTTAA